MGSPVAIHLPCLVMPMGTTSYFSGSIARITLRAEARETSCSLDWPPNTTPTLIFLGKANNSEAGPSPVEGQHRWLIENITDRRRDDFSTHGLWVRRPI